MNAETKTKPRVTLQSAGPAIWHYTVRNKYAWASIYCRPFVSPDGKHFGVETMVNSDYGIFGYCWTHIGPDDWRGFLTSMSMDYAMNKMAGRGWKVAMDRDELIDMFRKMIDEEEAEIKRDAEEGDEWEKEQREWDEMRDALKTLERYDDLLPEMFFREFDRLADGVPYARDWWEVNMQKNNPQAVHFWNNLWVPFTDFLCTEEGKV